MSEELAEPVELPLLVEVHEVARLIGWSRRRTHRLLARELKIARRLGSRWVVSRHDLRAAIPEAYEELCRRVAEGDFPPQQRQGRGRPRRAAGGRRRPQRAVEGQGDLFPR
jgi:hypothetical protein